MVKTTRDEAMSRVGLLGAGRQAAETSGYCAELGFETAFFAEESAPAYPREELSYGAPILPLGAAFASFARFPVVSVVGSQELRRRLLGLWPGNVFLTVVSPAAWLARDVTVGVGSTVAPLAALNRSVEVGEHVLVNVGAFLSHDVVIGSMSTISPGCKVGGCTRIGAGVFVGTGATVIDHVVIGDGACVGAGAVVVDDVAAHQTVTGVPPRPRKRGPE